MKASSIPFYSQQWRLDPFLDPQHDTLRRTYAHRRRTELDMELIVNTRKVVARVEGSGCESTLIASIAYSTNPERNQYIALNTFDERIASP